MRAEAAPVLSDRALNRALLERQLLLERRPAPAAAAIDRLVGLQAQVPQAPYVSLWSRLTGFTTGELSGLIGDRAAVRAGLFRVTIHLVSAADCLTLRPQLQGLFASRFRSSPYARELAGVDLGRLAAETARLLAEPLTRAQLGLRLSARRPGVDRLALAYAGTYLVPTVQVPPRGEWGGRGQARWQSVAAFLGREPHDPGGFEPLVLRYLAAFGPAAPADFTAWSGIPATRAFATLRPSLRVFRDERGRELLDVKDGPLPDPATPAPPRFLGEFDNVLLAHADRRRVITGGRTVPGFGGNGATCGTVLVDGMLAATWRLDRAHRTVAVEPFTPLGRRAAGEVAAEAVRLARFITGADCEVRVARP